MKVYNKNKTELLDYYDLNKGYLSEDTISIDNELQNILIYIPYTNEELLEIEKNALRKKRDAECFDIYNRNYPKGHYTQEQISELDKWYLEWLDVPNKYELGMDVETIIPERPKWIK